MSRSPNIHDVAEALGMHKSTVSQALSGKGTISASTRDRVRRVARELGYAPNPLAQRLAHGQSHSLVCLVSGLLDVGLATEKVLLIQKALNARSLEVPIYTLGGPGAEGGQSQATRIEQLCRQRPRAIICAASVSDPAVLRDLEAYQHAGGIIVSYDSPMPLICDQVVFDREDNAYQGARHLLEAGHRRIGLAVSTMAAWSAGASSLPIPNTQRMNGFQRALAEYGVALRPEWYFAATTYEKGGMAMARQFLQMNERPTALCIVNDYVALGFMVEALKAGVRVPEQVSLVSYDDQPVAECCPVPLTAVSHPADQIAAAVVELLSERLAGSQEPPRTVTIRGKLTPRQSVAAPVVD